MGHFSFIFCVLKYILNDCYVTGKWHSYFSNDLIYRFISFRARRDYYDLQSRGQSHLPDDSLLQAQHFWPSDNPSSQRETLTGPESTKCWRIHTTCRSPYLCGVLGSSPQLSPKLHCGQLPAHSPLTQSSVHTREKNPASTVSLQMSGAISEAGWAEAWLWHWLSWLLPSGQEHAQAPSSSPCPSPALSPRARVCHIQGSTARHHRLCQSP